MDFMRLNTLKTGTERSPWNAVRGQGHTEILFSAFFGNPDKGVQGLEKERSDNETLKQSVPEE